MSHTSGIEITSNLDIRQLEAIKKYIGSPHGMSILALTMIDPEHRDLSITVKLDGNSSLDTFVEYLIGIWRQYEPIKSVIRSVQMKGVFLSTYEDIQLQQTDQQPVLENFGKKNNIIDIQTNGLQYTFKIYRANESGVRVLKLIAQW